MEPASVQHSASHLPELQVAVGVLEDERGRVLIARRSDDAHQGGAWEFPGGKIDSGETGVAGLARELLEELGIRVIYARHLLCSTHAYPERIVRLHVWRVLRWDGECPQDLGAEGQPLRWLEVDVLLDEGLLPADKVIVTTLQALAVKQALEWQKFADAVS
jgi:8-oxo-dGTP diphosphatase